MTLEITLDDAPRGRRAEVLAHRLRAAVRSGMLRAGTRLPPSRSLANDLGVSRGVVVRAYEQLTAEGYLLARQGHGTEVAQVHSAPDSDTHRIPQPPSNPGLPAGASFPREAWLRAAARALSELPDAELGYPHPAGHARLRAELSRYLGRVRAVVAPPERIVIVNGFAQGSRLIAEVLLARGIDRIGVEDPGSVGLRDQLSGAGLTCVPVPVDDEGLQVEALDRRALTAVVATPAHQFPTGVVMSAERRHALLRWAQETGAYLLEDDYDAEFRYDRAPVGALQGLAPEHVLYGGSVSKTLAPGLRVGWLVLPDAFVVPLTEAKYATDLATGVWEQATLARFLAAGDLDRHVRRMGARYRSRRDRLVAELAEHLPGWRVTGTAAGLHLVVHAPPEHDGSTLASLAQRCGLDVRPLAAYAVDATAASGLVVGYGHQPPDRLSAAVRELATCLPPAATA